MGAPRNLQQPQQRQKLQQTMVDHERTLGHHKKLPTGKSELARAHVDPSWPNILTAEEGPGRGKPQPGPSVLPGDFGLTNGPWLFYGKAGGGWVSSDDFTVTNLTTGSSVTVSNNNVNSGWLVGAGIEWAFASNWSAKVEYNYLGLDDRTFTIPAGSPFLAGDTFNRSNRNVQMVKVGINYLFNWSGYRY